MLLIDAPDEEVVRRLSGRRTCVKNGHVYHVEFDPPKNEGVCDQDGSRLVQRDDDKPETVKKRLQVYHDQTEPLIERYEDSGLLRRFDGTRTPEEVNSHIRATLATLASRPRSVISARPPTRSSEWPPRAGSSPLPQQILPKARPGSPPASSTGRRAVIRSQGAEPAFKGYRGFPDRSAPRRTRWSCTASRALPARPRRHPLDRHRRVLDGWVADAAITHPIGTVTPIASRLLASTRAALFDAVEQCRPGNRLGDVSHAVQARVEQDGFSVIRSLVGHGIGRDMHEDPQIPNFGDPGTGPELEEGMVLAIEPMVNAGTHHVRMGSDNWAVYSQDGSLAAHFEHTVAITADGRASSPLARAGRTAWRRPRRRLSPPAGIPPAATSTVGVEPSPGLPRPSSFDTVPITEL